MNTNQPTESALRRRKIIFYCLLGSVAVLSAVVFFHWESAVRAWEFMVRIQTQKEQFRDWIYSFGHLGPLVYIGFQAAQVIFSPLPGELTGAFLGGVIFGVWASAIYSTIGLTLGSCLAFAVGRWLGRPIVEKLVSRSILEKFDFLVADKGALFAFIFFAIPGFPKDYVCYLLGLSPLSVRVFLIVVTLGRFPGALVFSLMGANLYNERYFYFFAILIGILIAGGLAAYFKDRIMEWVRGKAEKSGRG
ncbi:MAG: TVP38/TMEM64 family protein [Nitrospinota bacterium]|nr:TVP38/TMEM64 family protein [Nitrospinota bacterium]